RTSWQGRGLFSNCAIDGNENRVAKIGFVNEARHPVSNSITHPLRVVGNCTHFRLWPSLEDFDRSGCRCQQILPPGDGNVVTENDLDSGLVLFARRTVVCKFLPGNLTVWK